VPSGGLATSPLLAGDAVRQAADTLVALAPRARLERLLRLVGAEGLDVFSVEKIWRPLALRTSITCGEELKVGCDTTARGGEERAADDAGAACLVCGERRCTSCFLLEDELEWASRFPGAGCASQAGEPRRTTAPASDKAVIFISRRMVRDQSLSLYDNGSALGLDALDALVSALVGIMLTPDHAQGEDGSSSVSGEEGRLIGGGRVAARSACQHLGTAPATDSAVAAGHPDQEAEGASALTHEMERLVRSMLMDGAAAAARGHGGGATSTESPPAHDDSSHRVPAADSAGPCGLGAGHDACASGAADEEQPHADLGRQAGQDRIVANASAGPNEQPPSQPLPLQGGNLSSHDGRAQHRAASIAGNLEAVGLAARWLPSA